MRDAMQLDFSRSKRLLCLPDIRSKAPVRETVVPAKAGTPWRTKDTGFPLSRE